MIPPCDHFRLRYIDDSGNPQVLSASVFPVGFENVFLMLAEKMNPGMPWSVEPCRLSSKRRQRQRRSARRRANNREQQYAAKQCGWTDEQQREFSAECNRSNYRDLLSTVLKHFDVSDWDEDSIAEFMDS